MSQNLKYLLSVNYPIQIDPIPNEEGGGFCVSIPILGKSMVRGDGESIEEALTNLNFIKEQLIIQWHAEGRHIPVPEDFTIEEHSGKFLLRLPKELHFDLNRRAKQNGSTLNQFCVYLLSKSFVADQVETCMQRLEASIRRIEVRGIQFNGYDYTSSTTESQYGMIA